MSQAPASTDERSRDLPWLVAVLVPFVVVRIAILIVRDPFFDEIFTTWLVGRPFGAMFEALRHDSGPPLYYVLLKAIGATSVTAARLVSLACSCASALILLSAKRLGRARFLAVLLLAFYVPAALHGVDARAYALCAMFVTAGIVAIVYERAFLAALAFVLAAYSHYYGVLFFATLPRARAAALAIVLFIPGLLLAWRQPGQAMGWLSNFTFNPLETLSMAGDYPESLFRPAVWPLIALSLVLLIAAAARDWRFARFALIPLALSVLFGVFGRPVYFPVRFESVIAVPLMLWTAQSLERWSPRARVILASALCLIGAYICIAGIADHAQRPASDRRRIAVTARDRVPASTPIIASGSVYLEAASVMGDRVVAFPAEQAEHPGWRAMRPAAELRAEARALPYTRFVWIGERAAPERPILCERFTCRTLLVSEWAMMIEMAGPRS